MTFFVCSVAVSHLISVFFFFFFNDTPTTDIYTLSLHGALPISVSTGSGVPTITIGTVFVTWAATSAGRLRACRRPRSEEHTSELQSLRHLVCRLLLEKKKIQ